MTAPQKSRAREVAGILGALVGLAAILAGMLLAEQVFGHLSVGVLRAFGMLSPDAYYTGTPAALEPALWLLALLYVCPLALFAACASSERIFSPSRRNRLKYVDTTLAVFAAISCMGLLWFAFDPSRSGYHEPLIRRWEELPYEGADLVFAATWVMIIVGALLVSTWFTDRSRLVRFGVPAVAFPVATPVLGTLFA